MTSETTTLIWTLTLTFALLIKFSQFKVNRYVTFFGSVRSQTMTLTAVYTKPSPTQLAEQNTQKVC